MARVFADIDMSLDGFIAGEDRSRENPLGRGGERLVWYGDDVNDPGADLETGYGGVDGAVLQAAMEEEGAVIMGRTTFELSLDAWGEEPPIHKPCFVLTHRPGAPLDFPGGTSFTFVTGGPEAAVQLAREAAAGRNVGVMGGARTLRSFLALGLLDELRIHLVPVLLGQGLPLFEPGLVRSGVDFEQVDARGGERAVHLVLRPRRPLPSLRP